jgi:predicted RNA-binding protein YlxR (DUF448 family)
MFEKKALKRIVRTPEGEITYDSSGKKSGKGAYICTNPECFAKIRKGKILEKTFKIEVPKEIYDELEEVLKDDQ